MRSQALKERICELIDASGWDEVAVENEQLKADLKLFGTIPLNSNQESSWLLDIDKNDNIPAERTFLSRAGVLKRLSPSLPNPRPLDLSLSPIFSSSRQEALDAKVMEERLCSDPLPPSDISTTEVHASRDSTGPFRPTFRDEGVPASLSDMDGITLVISESVTGSTFVTATPCDPPANENDDTRTSAIHISQLATDRSSLALENRASSVDHLSGRSSAAEERKQSIRNRMSGSRRKKSRFSISSRQSASERPSFRQHPAFEISSSSAKVSDNLKSGLSKKTSRVDRLFGRSVTLFSQGSMLCPEMSSTLSQLSQDAAQARSSACGSRHLHDRIAAVFPVWWNPSKATLSHMKVLRRGESAESASLKTAMQQRVLSPVGAQRLIWDLIAYLFIIYDCWATPFHIVFITDQLKPHFLKIMDWLITGFFTMDILLNLNTGYIKNNKVIFSRIWILIMYVRRWLLIDLLATATVPLEMLVSDGSKAQSLRLLQLLKLLRVLRLVKISQTMRFLQRTDNLCFQVVTSSKRVLQTIAASFLVVLNVHAHSCIFTILQETTKFEYSFSEAWQCYLRNFHAVYLALLIGSPLNSQGMALQLLEILIATEHLLLLSSLVALVILQSWEVDADSAHARHLQDQTLKYMKQRQLAVGTQIQVMHRLTEAQSAKRVQQDFQTFTSRNLPSQLRDKVAIELWEGKLQTLGLIDMVSDWNASFPKRLALGCSEEILASNSTLFDEDDLSFAAYHILYGEMNATCLLVTREIPSFRSGMWLGENALVNPSFRRGLRASAASSASVMVVPGEAFQKLLQDCGLEEEFEYWVREELWTGLCGRCGSIGDHFSDECPLIGARNLAEFSQRERKQDTDFVGADKELKEYLRIYDAGHLLKYLEEWKISCLSDLEMHDEGVLPQMISAKYPEVNLTDKEVNMLSPGNIAHFRESVARGVGQVMSRTEEGGKHLVFLSHYKLEAGTEAALMRSELEYLLREDPSLDLPHFDVPIFLDSEDLTNLEELQDYVENSHNVVLMLTTGVLTRPWCLIELVTAVHNKIPVMLVQVDKDGNNFRFPDESFYKDLAAGLVIDEDQMKVLENCKVDLAAIEHALREVFKSIAVQYSPHRRAQIRLSQLKTIIHQLSIDNKTILEQAPARNSSHAEEAAVFVQAKTSIRQGRRTCKSTRVGSGLGEASWTMTLASSDKERSGSL